MLKDNLLKFAPVITLVIALVLLLANQEILALEGIEELEWNNRIILIHSGDESNEIIDRLKHYHHEIKDRHIYWFVLSNQVIHTNYEDTLSENLYNKTLKVYFQDNEFNILLIGKDGGIKQEQKTLDLEKIFALIDTMPMRQQEMLRQSK